MSKIVERIKKSYGDLPFGIYILFIARIINRMGGFVHAFLAMFLQLKLGMNESQIANYMIVVGFMTMVSPYIGGRIADLRGRKTIYLIAQTTSALFLVPCGFLVTKKPEYIPLLLIASAVVGSLIGPINSAMVADLTTSMEQRKRAFSLLYLGINVGVAIGPMMGGFLFEHQIVLFFLIDTVSTLISVLLIGLFVKETRLTEKEMKAVEGFEKMEKGNTFIILMKRPVLVLFMLFSMLNAIVYAQGNFGLPLFLGSLYNDGALKFGLLMSLNAVIVLIFTIPLTELLKKNKPIFNVAIASFLYTVGFGMMGLIQEQFILFFLSIFLWTIGEILAVTNHNVFVMGHTPVNYRGRFNAMIDIVMGVGHFSGPKIMSLLTMNYDYHKAWFFIGGIAFVAMLGFLFTALVDHKLQA